MRKSKKRYNVLVFCITHLLSAFGYEFIFFIMTVHVYDISKSPLNVGIFTALTFFPKMFAPCYGVFVDRYDREKVFGITAGVVGVCIILMGSIRNLYGIYALWFVTSIFLVLIQNTRTALMTEVMPKDNFVWGNSVVLTSLNIAKLLAPLVGGIIMAFSAKNFLIYCTSLIYFVSMILALLMKLDEREKIAVKTIADVFKHVKDGLTYIVGNHQLKTLALVAILWRLFLGLHVSLLVVYIKSYLGQNDAYYGLFMTLIGVGSLIGSLLGPWIISTVNKHSLLFFGVLFHYVTFCVLGLLHNYHAAVATAFISFGMFYFTVVGLHSLRDQSTRSDFRGRVYGSVTALTTPPAIISMLLGGFLAELYGVEKVFLGAGILAVVTFFFVMFYAKFKKVSPRRSLLTGTSFD